MSETLHGKPWEDLDTKPLRMDKDTLATVRRIVRRAKKKYTYATSGCADAQLCCNEILETLAKL